MKTEIPLTATEDLPTSGVSLSLDIREANGFDANPIKLSFQTNAPRKTIEEVIVRGDDAPKQAEIQLAGGLSVDVDMNIPVDQKAGKFDMAVIIGNRNYAASGSPNVEFANRDAQVMKEYLIRMMGDDPENILYAEDATLSKFNEFFGGERDHRGKLFRFVMEKM